MNTLERMLEIKTRYNSLKVPKTKAAKEKYLDKAASIRREMLALVEANQEEISALIVKHAKSLNVMAPSGGPWCTVNSKIDMFQCHGTYFQLTLDNEYVGLVHLMENKCGMDNVELLVKVAKM
jgi:hypothetical protein